MGIELEQAASHVAGTTNCGAALDSPVKRSNDRHPMPQKMDVRSEARHILSLF